MLLTGPFGLDLAGQSIRVDAAVSFALLSRKIAYSDSHVEAYGPLVDKAWIEGDTVVMPFIHAEGAALRGQTLRGLELANEAGHYVAAKATITGTDVYLHAAGALHPSAVRYDWRSSPDGNLYDSAGLPASPFKISLDP